MPAQRRVAGKPGRRVLILVAAAVVAAVAFGWWLHARNFEDTDDAQVSADIVAVSSRVPGTVTAVHVVDNQVVKKGEVLIELDPTDLEVSVAQARAEVAQAEAQIASEQPAVSITEATNRAAVQQAQAQVDAGRANVDAAGRALAEARARERLAQSQLTRARALLAGSSIAQADYDQSVTAEDVATEAVAAADRALAARQAELQATLSGQRAVVQNAPREVVTRQATVEARQANLALAQARLHQAELNLGYAKLAAPADGVIGRKSVNPGERIAVGQQLMALTATGHLWVTANFRETQVRRMRVGQPAAVHVDALGRDFSGSVESFGGATGSQYSLLPPENASGNYVKVVQRIPVRIRIDAGQPGLERLRPGMSVEPSVSLR
ncbi:MAG TPA: HlyD family secretion protein [Anaeromyxobacter sp.]|nr:HlyD family secretion protein [Anaeromyxobacter sp.]